MGKRLFCLFCLFVFFLLFWGIKVQRERKILARIASILLCLIKIYGKMIVN